MPAHTQYFIIYLLDTIHKSLSLAFLWLCSKKCQILLVSLIVQDTYIKKGALGCTCERLTSQRWAKLKYFPTNSEFYISHPGQLSTIWAKPVAFTALSCLDHLKTVEQPWRLLLLSGRRVILLKPSCTSIFSKSRLRKLH